MKRALIAITVVWALVALIFWTWYVLARSFQPRFLYYDAWLLLVGVPVWLARDRLAGALRRWRLPALPKFLLLGYGAVLLEEIFAAFFNNLSEGFGLALFIERVGQFWALNTLAFSGFIFGWLVLLRWLRYSRTEAFYLAGCWGLFAEHTITFVFAAPLVFVLLAPLNILTYGLILTPALLSIDEPASRRLHPLLRYPLTFAALFACSLIPIAVLQTLRAHFPGVFPPRRFVA